MDLFGRVHCALGGVYILLTLLFLYCALQADVRCKRLTIAYVGRSLMCTGGVRGCEGDSSVPGEQREGDSCACSHEGPAASHNTGQCLRLGRFILNRIFHCS